MSVHTKNYLMHVLIQIVLRSEPHFPVSIFSMKNAYATIISLIPNPELEHCYYVSRPLNCCLCVCECARVCVYHVFIFFCFSHAKCKVKHIRVELPPPACTTIIIIIMVVIVGVNYHDFMRFCSLLPGFIFHLCVAVFCHALHSILFRFRFIYIFFVALFIYTNQQLLFHSM